MLREEIPHGLEHTPRVSRNLERERALGRPPYGALKTLHTVCVGKVVLNRERDRLVDRLDRRSEGTPTHRPLWGPRLCGMNFLKRTHADRLEAKRFDCTCRGPCCGGRREIRKPAL